LNNTVITEDEMKEFTLLRKIFKHTNAEKFQGVYFICGETGEKDQNGLPEKIMVCPAFGADYRCTIMYEKVKK